SATVAVNGTVGRTLSLSRATLAADLPLPPGPGYDASFSLQRPDLGTLQVTIEAQNAAGSAAPFSLSLPIVNVIARAVLAPVLGPSTVPAGIRSTVTATARIVDDCRVRNVKAIADLGRGVRRLGTLRDDGKRGEAAAGDGVFT